MFFFFDENEYKVNVPGFEQTIKPILQALQEKGGQASIEELDDAVIKIMNLPYDVVNVMHNNSDRQKEISYRIAWGRTYLKKYGLITNVSRGVWAFTEKFDGNIDNINVGEIVRMVRKSGDGHENEDSTLTGFESAIAFENMVKALIEDIANKKGKEVEYGFSDFTDLEYDIILPDGLEKKDEKLKCIIEYVHMAKPAEQDFYVKAVKKINNSLWFGNILVITNINVSVELRNRFASNVEIWDKKDLIERIDPEAAYVQYIVNPKQALIEDVVTTNETGVQKNAEREQSIRQIKKEFRKENIVLFLGAGVSIDGGVPLWGNLIKTLHVYMLNILTKDKELSFEQQEMIKELAADNEMESPIMQMRYIKAAFSNDEYYKLVHTALYEKGTNLNTRLLDAIAKICAPQRSYCGINGVITYNFDDLLERKFTQKDIQYNTVWSESGRSSIDELNIYHVHGYLPSDFSEVSDSPNIVFTEEDYHKIYQDSYSWSNLVQLSALRDNTCLFIGCSLTDPNLRRLLDVSSKNDESPRHYAFLKRKKINETRGGKKVNKEILEMYQKLDSNIQTGYYKKLGLNIIWVDEFEEIPDILNGFLD